MPVKKISNINDEIDVKLFLDIIGKNIHLIGLLLLITLCSWDMDGGEVEVL